MTARQPPGEKGAKACTIGIPYLAMGIFCTFLGESEKGKGEKKMEGISRKAEQEILDAAQLRQQAEQSSLSAVLGQLGARQTRIPYRRRMAEMSLEELTLSVRSRNCLMRAGLRTFGDLNERLGREGDIAQIRNLGTKSREEIIRVFRGECYARLNAAEQQDYWQRVLENDLS